MSYQSLFLMKRLFILTTAGEVRYDSGALKDVIQNYPIDNKQAFIMQLVLTALNVKNPVWSYEEEQRLVRDVPGLLEIQGDFVKQICFGLRVLPSDISLIKNIARHHCNGDIVFAQMIRAEDELEFGMKMQDIT